MTPGCAPLADGGGRAKLLLSLLLLVFVGLSLRLTQIQYLKHSAFADTSRGYLSAAWQLAAQRADIRDAKGRVLATSIAMRSCALDPQIMKRAGKDLDSIVGRLQTLLDLSPVEVDRIRARASRQGARFVWVRRQLPTVLYRKLEAEKLPGLYFPREFGRKYPQGQIAAHVIGFPDIDGKGLEGIEKIFDTQLRGEPEKRWGARDGRRRRLVSGDVQANRTREGRTVVLTIDATVQAITENELARAVARYRGPATTGCAVVMDPYSGDILALANCPTFDPNDPTASPPENRLNRAVASIYEPGSTFKPFVLARALEAGSVTLTTRIHCENGAWRMPNGRVLHDAHGYGYLTAEYVVVKSSNIGIAKIAARLGMKNLHALVRDFGFGERTGVGLPAELPGQVRPLRQWTSYSLGSVPMGQEIAATPLQLATAYAVIANGGVLLRPRIVKELRGGNGLARKFPVVTRRRVLRPETAATMRMILRKVVAKGTGKRARMDEFWLGGKTGTSQLPVNAAERRAGHRGYSPNRYVATFVGIAPWDVPRLVILVSVREPRGAYYGGVVAAPAVREIARRCLLYLKVRPRNR